MNEAPSAAASERFITADNSSFPDFSEELEQFSVAGDLLHNLTLKALTGQPLTSVLRTYIEGRTGQLKGDIYLLKNRILQCELKSVAPTVISKNGTYFEGLKKRINSIRQELQIRWGVAENCLLALIMLNLVIHVYTLSFILRVRTYKKLVQE